MYRAVWLHSATKKMINIIINDIIRFGAGFVPPKVDKDWQDRVKRLLKAELSRAGVSYRELAERLRAIGIEGENERNIANKIARGGFSAAFFFQCMEAIGRQTIHLDTDR
jgi:hypothetical protein